ncbi:putative nitric-oxide synthase [Ordospora colligata]|uniref:Putative nitric-oxide synthase n=1 Tax=Ordospora colligata OC4 TaxID=1354746 RepID=A0A0B2UMP9_9MICR|nr:putative nitric-oxide synthase [Ordospora colligata OC4]KHN70579.1 putative nitric-oxide synthase [Ordospora colligata OC4]TBU17329.1 putative nitric-oxide synthase [Ordospora colligata]TBU17579.1 putative nitric-oxide synthase [Ordospora colligata]TBU19759.1 putative nitric-oxide synthase [Ordospora colligata]
MIPILYGSQTGTSRYVCRLLERAAVHGYSERTIYDLESFTSGKESKTQCIVQSIDEFGIERLLDTNIVVFVCSTHGDGGEPFNMSRFWAFLSRDDLPDGILSHLKFAVFGLGSSTYEKFNYCSKRLFNRLVMLGATPIIRRGEGNAQDKDGFLTDLRPWAKELVECLHTLKSEFRISMEHSVPEEYDTILIEKSTLTSSDHHQKIVEFVFDIPEYKDFCPGDCISFLPTNYNYTEFMQYNQIKSEDYAGIDVEYIIKNTVDFNSPPRQIFFFELKHFLVGKQYSEEHLQKIDEIANSYDLYYSYVHKPRRTTFEVLKEFKVRVDIRFLIDFVPTIYPRFFSVARVDGKYHITVAIVEYYTSIADPRRSICSEYLLRLAVGDKVKVGIGRSNLYFESKKLLFLCTGAGITLARTCINEFKNKEIVVFYGFRHRDKDFLYCDEWNKQNVKLFCAASRDDGVYIQDVFKKNPVDGIDEYLVFVSGNSRLNKVVEQMLQEVYGKKISFQSETW